MLKYLYNLNYSKMKNKGITLALFFAVSFTSMLVKTKKIKV